jgi:hypothetical protein
MANKEMQDLYIAGEKITVPAWSTETTLSAVAGYSEATAKSLDAMLKSQGKEGAIARDNKKIFSNILTAQKNTVDQAETAAKNAQKDAKNADKASKKELAELKKASDERVTSLKSFTKSFNDQDLEGMTKAIAGTGMLGVAAGIAVGTVVQFSKDLTEMSNIGVGFGDTLLELKAHSTATGLSLADYGKLVSGNLDGMIALGGTVHEGARLFSGLSRQIRDASNDFHQFGLSNMEMNQVIADEIELRRKSGMQQSLIAGNVAASMNDLMLETSALANITGQDRREVMRARNEAMNDEVTSAFIGTLSDAARDNVLGTSAIFSKLGAAGDTMFSSIFGGMASGVDSDVINGGVLAKLTALSPEIGTMISGIDDFITANVGNESNPEYLAELTSMVGNMQNAISGDERERLSLIALTNGSQAENARLLLGMRRDAAGLNTDAAENQQEFIRTSVEMALSPLIGLGSTFEDAAVTLQLAALETVIGGFDTLMAKLMGDSDIVGAAGTSMIGALDALTAAYTDTNLVGGTYNLLKDVDKSTLLMAGAATALLGYLRGREGAGTGSGVGGTILSGLGVYTAIAWGKSVVTRATAGAVNIVSNAATAARTAAVATARVTSTSAAAAAREASAIITARSIAAREAAIVVANAARVTSTSAAVKAVQVMANAARILGGPVSLAAQFIAAPTAAGDGTMPEPDDYRAAIEAATESNRADAVRESRIYKNETRTQRATDLPPIIEHNAPIQAGQVRPTETGALETGMTTDNAWRHGIRGQRFLESLMPSPPVVEVYVEPIINVHAPAVPSIVIPEQDTPTINVHAPAIVVPEQDVPAINVHAPAIVVPEQDVPAINVHAPAIVVPEQDIPTINVPAPVVPAIVVPEQDIPTTNVHVPAIVVPEQVAPNINVPAPVVPAIVVPEQDIPTINVPAPVVPAVEVRAELIENIPNALANNRNVSPIIDQSERTRPEQPKPTKHGASETDIKTDSARRNSQREKDLVKEQEQQAHHYQNYQKHAQETNHLLRRLITAFENN